MNSEKERNRLRKVNFYENKNLMHNIRNIIKMISKLATELLGSLFFISTILLSKGNAFLIGTALALAILVGGKVSGAHFNPAVSFVKYMQKEIKSSQLMLYVIAQLIGGLLSISLVKAVL